ncbi:capsular polysaccharide biosynthesis protein [Billgrantia diversa]|nr:capsular polysaccharide biosynthesis protein [Halomonas sp. MCCC 1A13316]
MKSTSSRARKIAKRHGLAYVAIEDGFLRSRGLGVMGHAPHSLVVDQTGIYYDATRPSDLERLIHAAPDDPERLQRARDGMARLRQLRLSKYNHAPDHPLPSGTGPRVLVVDQTVGDASITLGLANAHRFQTMLEVALAEHPDAEILVKIHPDVAAGKKQGHLMQAGLPARCRLITADINPWALLDAVETVHVVTSQLGFEALMAGKRVVCHGMPFYAGWGLTEDRQTCARRGQPRTLEQLFDAAYLRYARYANPYTGQSCRFEDTLELIAEQKRRNETLAGNWLGVGFSVWKQRFISHFLGDSARLRHVATVEHAAPGPDERQLVWSSQHDTRTKPASDAPASVWRIEDGFIRSVGLGVDLIRPLSLVLDSRGIYYDPSSPSDLEHLLLETDFNDRLLTRARRLRQRLVELGLTKYNVGRNSDPLPELPAGQRCLLVIGQVESDASLRQGSPKVTTNSELLHRVRGDNPDAYILYKPHPDVVTGARLGQLDSHATQQFNRQVTNGCITNLLRHVDELHTMSSLSGFEALMRDCHVVTYGMPFYAGWGLTDDRGMTCPRRHRRLSLDELVAGCLILYPTYVEPHSGHIVNVETVVDWLEQQRPTHLSLPISRRLYRGYRNLFIGRH